MSTELEITQKMVRKQILKHSNYILNNRWWDDDRIDPDDDRIKQQK